MPQKAKTPNQLKLLNCEKKNKREKKLDSNQNLDVVLDEN